MLEVKFSLVSLQDAAALKVAELGGVVVKSAADNLFCYITTKGMKIAYFFIRFLTVYSFLHYIDRELVFLFSSFSVTDIEHYWLVVVRDSECLEGSQP